MSFRKSFVSCMAFCALGLAVVATSRAAERPEDRGLPAPFQKLLPLHVRLATPRPGDWLAEHHEPGQTFGQYVRSRPIRAEARRRAIYLQPLGDFNPTQRKILDATTEFLDAYFALPVIVREDLPLDIIPKHARRRHPTWGMDQILAPYVLDSVLRPRMPRDAVAFLGLTASDLWPGEGWNFVFGLASLDARVGVWSLYRNGDPDESDEAFRLCLRRTVQMATHETGHIFSMRHCTLFECNMCGSNHREESDRRPLALCPHCLAKLCYATGADPTKRFEKLLILCAKHGLKNEEAFYRRSLEALRQ